MDSTDASKALGDSSPLGISTLFRSLGGWGTVRLLTESYKACRADHTVPPVGQACCKRHVAASRAIFSGARILIELFSMVRTLAVGSASGCVFGQSDCITCKDLLKPFGISG